jgi:phenylpropionate dioxygenase-like ring-hydroxylating dioxygenase large terminal subunit
MLTKEDTELLTRVGAGTPMGALMRQYWLPFALSSELPGVDCDPLRVRLLGEDLIAFRDSNGQVGMLANNCPHRGASLFFGRNEESGLRCVYHGWKFDTTGQCIDMPNEPAESDFKTKVKAIAYPCREVNGTLWTYMGPRHQPPPLPDLEWALLPASHRVITPFVRECNWMQALEGDIDSSHSSFLHSVLTSALISDQGTGLKHKDRAPRFHIVDTDYGIKIAVERTADEEHRYWRITQFLMPIFTMFPPTGEHAEMVPGHVWIPMDDATTLVWSVYWHPLRPVTEGGSSNGTRTGNRSQAFAGPEEYLPPTTAPAGRWRWKANPSNDYLLDREAQRTKRFSGVPTIPLQDQAMTESMGPTMDRTAEHLGSTDAAIIRARRRLLDAARQLRDTGVAPASVDHAALFRVRSASGLLPKDVSWLDATSAWVEARPDRAVVSA